MDVTSSPKVVPLGANVALSPNIVQPDTSEETRSRSDISSEESSVDGFALHRLALQFPAPTATSFINPVTSFIPVTTFVNPTIPSSRGAQQDSSPNENHKPLANLVTPNSDLQDQRVCQQKSRGTSARSAFFPSLIIPLSDVPNGQVDFHLRRSNKTVTLQWEPFHGVLNRSGVAYIEVVQSLNNLPPYPMSWLFSIERAGVKQIGEITLDLGGRIRFYFNLSRSGSDTHMGDLVVIGASSVTWIVNTEGQ